MKPFLLTLPKKMLKKPDSVVKKSIKTKLEKLLNNPIKNARKHHNNDLGEYRWRIGDYRVVFNVEKDKVIILKVAHRRKVYKDY